MIHYTNTVPDKDQFFFLFETTGWNGPRMRFTADDLERALLSSWYQVAAYHQDQLVGFARLVSDGVYQTFLCDMIVRPEYQGQGIGSHIMSLLLVHCKESGIQWIQLSAARGKASFYHRFGFTERPGDAPGMQIYLRQL